MSIVFLILAFFFFLFFAVKGWGGDTLFLGLRLLSGCFASLVVLVGGEVSVFLSIFHPSCARAVDAHCGIGTPGVEQEGESPAGRLCWKVVGKTVCVFAGVAEAQTLIHYLCAGKCLTILPVSDILHSKPD